MNSNGPKVSIGMPVFNGEPFIFEAIDSILGQTYTDFELIISDNASNDKTEEICREYSAKDERVRYYRNESNIGAPQNYNRTFNLASGRYFRWANADDVAEVQLLEKCVQVLEQRPDVVLCYGKTRIIDQDGQVTEDYDDNLDLQDAKASERYIRFNESVGLTNVIYGLMRSEKMARTALFGNYIAADVNFMAELCLYGKFVEIPEVLFYRRMHKEASSWDRADDERQRAFWMPDEKSFYFQTVKKYAERVRAIKKAPLAVAEKMQLYIYCLKRIYWHKHKIAKDFKRYLNRNNMK